MNISVFASMSRKTIVLSAVVLVVFVVGVYRYQSHQVSLGGTITAKRASISEVVAVTGSIEPANAVELSFQNSGRIVRAFVRVGDRVTEGQLLASLDTAELAAQLRDAQATLLAQTAKLNNIQSGGRAEEIAIQESDVRSAQLALNHAYEGVYEVLMDAFTKADNALRVQLYPLFTSTGSDGSPQYGMTVTCQCDAASFAATSNRARAEMLMIRWKAELSDLSLHGTPETLVRALINANTYMAAVRDTVGAVGTLLEDSTLNLYMSTSTVQDYRTRVATARAAIDTGATALSTRRQLIDTDEAALERAQRTLTLTKAGSTKYEVDAQRAAVMSAQAEVDRYQAQIARNMIRSPINGIVTRQDAKPGQTATANAGLLEVISAGSLEIESYIPEVDIGKVALQNKVRVVADALPDDTFAAHVIFIEPAETVIDGVVKFKVKMALDSTDERLKSGMTVNLDIVTREKSDVVIVPQFAIIENDEGTFVQKVTSSGTERVAVELGIRDQEGMVEVISGLQENDTIENIGLKTAQ